MSLEPPESEPSRWELRPAGCFVALERDGVRIVSRRGRAELRIPYGDLTHVDATPRGAWLASTASTLLLRRSQFQSPDAPEALAQALIWRLGERPGGDAQLSAMRQVGELARRPYPGRVSRLVAMLCVAVFVLELVDPLALDVGSFVPALVARGEIWRIATANFLHGLSIVPLHLALNALCLLAFGVLVEHPLGATRTLLILGAGAVGSMVGSAIAGYSDVVGASGMVAALAGAVLWLELHEAERMPAWWRIPRRIFITVLILQVGIDLLLPFIAGAAHIGGFVAGYGAAHFVAADALRREPTPTRLRWAAAAVVVLAAVSFAPVGRLVQRDGAALARHGQRLLSIADTSPADLNDLAWRMVTESELDEDALNLTTVLAERAVAETDRSDPDFLDTLAETLFARGDQPAAIDVIDEAIQLTGGEQYFREQRKRFTGERAADDRPEPPDLPWALRRLRLHGFRIEPGLSI